MGCSKSKPEDLINANSSFAKARAIWIDKIDREIDRAVDRGSLGCYINDFNESFFPFIKEHYEKTGYKAAIVSTETPRYDGLPNSTNKQVQLFISWFPAEKAKNAL